MKRLDSNPLAHCDLFLEQGRFQILNVDSKKRKQIKADYKNMKNSVEDTKIVKNSRIESDRELDKSGWGSLR